MSDLTFRLATKSDIPYILVIIRQAQENFRLAQIDQWQNGYPNEEVIQNDIDRQQSFVLVDKNQIIATAMITWSNDPNYAQIEGEWITPNPYVVVHRLAVLEDRKGQNIAGKILEWVEKRCLETRINSMRIDTHRDNRAMQRVIAKFGFQYCGIIKVSDGTPRLAFEKVLFQ